MKVESVAYRREGRERREGERGRKHFHVKDFFYSLGL
jgi:hypothetical protein